MRKYAIIAAGLLLSAMLGATVFREPVAWAAQTVDANIIGPLDDQGFLRVHATPAKANQLLSDFIQAPAGGSVDRVFSNDINASLVTISVGGQGPVGFLSFDGLSGNPLANRKVFEFYGLTEGNPIVIPLPVAQWLTEVHLQCPATNNCYVSYTILGRD
jgi:hypothetical protein